MEPKKLSIKNYSYQLPPEQIALYPLPERDASKLLIYKKGNIEEDVYKNLTEHLPSDSLLIFNDTKVVEARLLFKKSTGGVIEIFCLEPHEKYSDISLGMMQRNRVLWKCLIGGASKWKHGQMLEKKLKSDEKEITLEAKYVEKRTDCFVIEFSWNDSSLNFAEILHRAGVIPLPPYIKREPETSDRERYQTIFAHDEGSVAAPTAGLHFTEKVLRKLSEKNIQTEFVTLHVGAGTFKPVKSETMESHEMHSEFLKVSKETVQNIFYHLSKHIIAVGTTSLRTIESLYWLGVKLKHGMNEDLIIAQWDPYELENYQVGPEEALISVMDFMSERGLEHIHAKTQILIAPSYQFKLADGLITNFHMPQSTLLLLVAAFIGEDWKKVYEYALKNNFRFLSYGDGSLLWKN